MMFWLVFQCGVQADSGRIFVQKMSRNVAFPNAIKKEVFGVFEWEFRTFLVASTEMLGSIGNGRMVIYIYIWEYHGDILGI